MIGRRQVAFGVWGDGVGRAIELSALAGASEILLDATVTDSTESDLGGEAWTDGDPDTAVGDAVSVVRVDAMLDAGAPSGDG